MKTRDAMNYMMWSDSYNRMRRLLDLREHLPARAWLRLLGEYWSLCDNNGLCTDEILFKPPVSDREGPIREMMTREEWVEFCDFPEVLHIYRGCYEGFNEDGHSYSLDEDVARKFVTYGRCTQKDARPMLIHAVIPKDEVVAYKNDRSEQEIIIREFCDIVDTIYLDEESEELCSPMSR